MSGPLVIPSLSPGIDLMVGVGTPAPGSAQPGIGAQLKYVGTVRSIITGETYTVHSPGVQPKRLLQTAAHTAPGGAVVLFRVLLPGRDEWFALGETIGTFECGGGA